MKKKIALVTGASGGIGAACAAELAKKGYTVLLHANRSLEKAEMHAAQLRGQGYDARALRCDLASSTETAAMCKEILSLYHRVDALVLNAGVSYTGLLCDMTDEEWHSVMDVNVSGMF